MDDARAEVNFSDWDREQDHAAFMSEAVRDGVMPLQGYVRFHPEADLDETEKRELIEGLQRTFDADPPG